MSTHESYRSLEASRGLMGGGRRMDGLPTVNLERERGREGGGEREREGTGFRDKPHVPRVSLHEARDCGDKPFKPVP